MTADRVQRALDGDLPLDQLEPPEVERFLQYRQAFTEALRPLGRLPDVDVAPAVLRAVAPIRQATGHKAAGRPNRPLAGLVSWLWTPRAFTARPAFGLVAAAVAVFLWSTQFTTPSVQESAVPEGQRIVVEFRLAAPEAGAVTLVGDFNDWQPLHELRQVSAGVWSVSVSLEPGVYDYGFLVDGSTLELDPLAPRVSDGFGGESSRLAVLAPEVRL